MTNRSLKVRSVASAAILGVALSTAAIGAPDAFAQTAGQAANTASANDSTITQSTGTLTIHKRANPDTTGGLPAPTGNVVDPAPGTALNGATFKVTKVPGDEYNLATNAGLLKASKLTVTEAQRLITNANASGTSEETAGEGVAVFDDLPIGVYLVEETGTPEGFTPAAPFLAFVPMTQGNAGAQGTTWNYDVHAYPKNYSKTPPVKTVKDIDQNIGGTIEYNIDTVVRQISEGYRLSYYYISDTLDRRNLDVENAQIAVKVTQPGGSEETLTVDTHYTLEKKDPATGEILVRFTGDGLKKLDSGTKVNVNIKAEKLTNGPIVPNEAFEYEPNNPGSDWNEENDTPPTPPTTPPTPPTDRYETPPVITYFSEVEFTKVDKAGEFLTGAEFQLVRTKAGDKECKASMDAEINTDGGTKVSALNNGETKDTFTTTDQGVVNISGLHVTDFANNAEVDESERSVYCLYETKAPAGKELLAQPIKFELLWDGSSKTTVSRTVYVYETANGETERKEVTRSYDANQYKKQFLKVGEFDNKVVNLDDTTPNLPLTGGLGVGILAAIGAGIVAAGAYFARRSAQQN